MLPFLLWCCCGCITSLLYARLDDFCIYAFFTHLYSHLIIRPRSRRSQSPPEYQRGYGGGSSKQGVPQNSRPHYNVGRDNYGKYDRREDHRPDSRSYEPSNSPPRVAQSYNDDNRSYTHGKLKCCSVYRLVS